MIPIHWMRVHDKVLERLIESIGMTKAKSIINHATMYATHGIAIMFIFVTVKHELQRSL